MCFRYEGLTRMGLEKFSPEDEIFVDEEVLRDTHTPDKLFERDDQLAEYQSALKPVIKGTRPKNIFLVGQTGVGKTVATKLIRERLEKDQEEFDHVDVEFIYLNCKKLHSSYAVAANLVNCFRDETDQIKTTGYTRDMIYGMLYNEIINRSATHVLLILDEVDSIGNDDEILYELPRCNDHGDVPPEETYVGVIGISNDFTFRDSLSARVKDTLCEEEIHFPPYDADELRTILEHRAEKAFIDGVIEDGVITLCSAFAGQESGSARQALNFLYKAGDLARSENSDQVTENHVRRAEPLVRESKVRSELESLPMQSQLTLYAILIMHATDRLPAKSTDIYQEYEQAASRITADVKTDRTIRDRLSELELKGFLEANRENPGGNEGRYDLYDIGDIDSSLIHDVLLGDDRLSNLFDSGQTSLTTYSG